MPGGPPARARVLYDALFRGKEGKLQQLFEKHKFLLKACAPEGDDMAHASQLLALEWLVGVAEPERIKETPFAMKASRARLEPRSELSRP